MANEQQQDEAAQVLNNLRGEIFFFHEQAQIANILQAVKEVVIVYSIMPENHYQSLSFPQDGKPPAFLS